MLRGTPVPEAQAFLRLAGTEPIVIGDIVLLEVLRGASTEARAQAIEAWLSAFTIVPMLDGALASRAAGHYRHLRGLGITPRSVPDLVIGAWCIAHAVPLLHRDRDFAAMAAHCGLRVQPA